MPGKQVKRLTKKLDETKVRQLILGNFCDVSRRSTGALTVMMGHRYPTTAMQSYSHLLLDWADELTPLKSLRVESLKGVFKTADLLDVEVATSKVLELKFNEPTLVNLFGVLRQVWLGKSFKQAGELVGLAPSHTHQLENAIGKASQKMRFKKRGETSYISGLYHPNLLVHYITEKGWRRVLENTNSLSPEDTQNLSVESVDDLVTQLGSNRQILVRTSEQIALVKKTLTLFDMTDQHYLIAAYQNNPQATQLIQEVGLSVEPLNSKKLTKNFQLCRMGVFENGHYSSASYDYAAFVLKENSTETIRNSLEMAMVLLVVGVHALINKN